MCPIGGLVAGWTVADFGRGNQSDDNFGLAEGDQVVTHFVLAGTQTGAFGAMPPTGRSAKHDGVSIIRIVGGRIVEDWTISDKLTILKQLGALPTAG